MFLRYFVKDLFIYFLLLATERRLKTCDKRKNYHQPEKLNRFTKKNQPFYQLLRPNYTVKVKVIMKLQFSVGKDKGSIESFLRKRKVFPNGGCFENYNNVDCRKFFRLVWR